MAQFTRSNAIPGEAIELGIQFSKFGLPFDPPEVGPVRITTKDPRDLSYDPGTDLLETIPIANVVKISTGLYKYTLANTTIAASGTFFDAVNFRFELGGDEFLVVQDFEVTVTGLPKLGYVTIEEIRAEGLTNTTKYPDTLINSRIQFSTKMIDNYTGRWFEARSLIMDVDGPGAHSLSIDSPIVSVDTVTLIDRGFPIANVFDFDTGGLVVYNRHISQKLFEPDDREDPKISNLYFPKGRLNIRIKGVFGYTDENGQTPIEIKRALVLMVLRDRDLLASNRSALTSGLAGQIVREKTDDHEYELAKSDLSVGSTAYFVGNPEIDNLLLQFRRPPRLGRNLGANITGALDNGSEFSRFRGGLDFFVGRG